MCGKASNSFTREKIMRVSVWAGNLGLMGIFGVSTALGGVFSVVSFTNDADSGISTANTYTHLVDPLDPTTATVNGVHFTNHERSVAGHYSISGMAGGGTTTTVFGAAKLMKDWVHEDDERATGLPMVVTLNGLTAGQNYDLRLYSSGEFTYGSAPITVTATNGTGSDVLTGYDEDSYGWHYIRYQYTAAANQVSLSFAHHIINMDREYKLYGFSQQVAVVPEPGMVGLLAMGGALAIRRRGITQRNN
jgi:MYXO-CTERM domain-containing protein